MESAPRGTRLPAGCTVNVTNTGRVRPVTSPTAGTTVEAPTMATVTSPERSCVSAMTAGKVRAEGEKIMLYVGLHLEAGRICQNTKS